MEIFFDVLKNGCKVEALQLSSIERLELAFALFMIIAWRVQMLMRLGRPARKWIVKCCSNVTSGRRLHRGTEADSAATAIVKHRGTPYRQLWRFPGHKGDGEAGVKTIGPACNGMDFAAGIRAYKAGEICV